MVSTSVYYSSADKMYVDWARKRGRNFSKTVIEALKLLYKHETQGTMPVSVSSLGYAIELVKKGEFSTVDEAVEYALNRLKKERIRF